MADHRDVHIRLDPRLERKIGNLLDALEALVRRLAEPGTDTAAAAAKVGRAADAVHDHRESLQETIGKDPKTAS